MNPRRLIPQGSLLAMLPVLGCSQANRTDPNAGTPHDLARHDSGVLAPNEDAANANDQSNTGAVWVPASAAEMILQGSCATATVKSSLRPANLLFVLDRTGTMACNPPPTTASASCEQVPERADPGLPSKWEITRDALRSAIAALPTNAYVGISYFSNDGVCGVSAAPSVAVGPVSDQQIAAIHDSIDSITPGGGTPLVGAVILAYRHLHELALSGRISGDKFVVLLSDGEQSEECSNPPLCEDAASCYDLLLERELPKAAGPGVGIRTFVIGAPGSEPSRSVLSQIASSGGTAPPGCDVALGNCHFDMTQGGDFAEELSGALRSILGEAISCELNLPDPGEGKELDLDAINVVYSPSAGEPTVVPQDTATACDQGAQGWQYTEGPSTKIRLCGAICDTIRADTNGRVDVVLGCPVVVPI